MLQHLFPPLSLTSSLSPLSILYLADAQLVLLFVSISLLLWTWASRLPDEVRLGWRTGVREPRARIARDQLWVPGPRLVRFWFCILSSRYAAILQALVAVTLLSIARRSANACSASRYLPFGFTAVHFLAHLTMALRVSRLFVDSEKLVWILGALVLIDAGVQAFADGLVRPTFIPLLSFHAEPISNVCYLSPSSHIFSLAFISPSIFHHVILLLTLYASWKHAQVQHTLGKGRSVIEVLRREQCHITLGVCLVNFANVILVLQPHTEYRMINFLPSMCLTQILLGRIHFALRAFLESRDRACRDGRQLPSFQSLVTEGGDQQGWSGSWTKASGRKRASVGGGGGDDFEMAGLRLSTGNQQLVHGPGTPPSPQSTYSTYSIDSTGLVVPAADSHPSPPITSYSSARRSSLPLPDDPSSAPRKRHPAPHPPPRNRHESLPPLTSLPQSVHFRSSLPSISVLHEDDEPPVVEGDECAESGPAPPPLAQGYLAPPPSPEGPKKGRLSLPPARSPELEPKKESRVHHHRTSREHWTPPTTWETEVAMAGAGVEERAKWGNPFAVEEEEEEEERER